MARSAVPAVLLALAAVLMHVPHTAAWTGTTIALSGAVPANRAPVMVLAPSSGAVKNASLPLLLLLQPRCKGMLSTDSVFHFTNLVDTVRAQPAGAWRLSWRAGSSRVRRRTTASHPEPP